MNHLFKGVNYLRQKSILKSICKTNQPLIAFQSSFTQDFEVLKQSEDYRKDLPDPTLANPYEKEKLQCILCKYGVQIDYKNVQLLSQFVSPFTGRLYDKHITGLCDRQQKAVQREHMKAIKYSLISPVYRDPKYHKDPKLFDPTRPQRPNPY